MEERNLGWVFKVYYHPSALSRECVLFATVTFERGQKIVRRREDIGVITNFFGTLPDFLNELYHDISKWDKDQLNWMVGNASNLVQITRSPYVVSENQMAVMSEDYYEEFFSGPYTVEYTSEEDRPSE